VQGVRDVRRNHNAHALRKKCKSQGHALTGRKATKGKYTNKTAKVAYYVAICHHTALPGVSAYHDCHSPITVARLPCLVHLDITDDVERCLLRHG
jgi:hypothetical protein